MISLISKGNIQSGLKVLKSPRFKPLKIINLVSDCLIKIWLYLSSQSRYMIKDLVQFVLEIVADGLLCFSQYKHRKHIQKMEQKDGIPRPIEKHLFGPRAIILFIMCCLAIISSSLFMAYQKFVTHIKTTQNELVQITQRMELWYNKYGQYPNTLAELIGNDPIRDAWEKDAWNHPYQFSISQKEHTFLIISAGPNGQFGTEDDLTSNYSKTHTKN